MLGIQQHVDSRGVVRLEITANNVANVIWNSDSITSDEYDEQITVLLEQAKEAVQDIQHALDGISSTIHEGMRLSNED